MYILFTDETNTDFRKNNAKFFVYGGLIVSTDKLIDLDKGVNTIRMGAGYKPKDSFKFDTNSRPSYVSRKDFSEAKNGVVKLCIKLQCKFIAYVVLYDIIKNKKIETSIEYGLNTIIGRFNYFLKKNEDCGIVIVDRLSNKKEYDLLRDKFVNGLKIEEKKIVPLERIKLYASSCDNASHFNSAMDIVLGSFRYCINHPAANMVAAKIIMKNIIKVLAREDIDKVDGLIFRPKKALKKYKEEYDKLLENIKSLL